jgi:superfamily I DNA/RNA helicase
VTIEHEGATPAVLARFKREVLDADVAHADADVVLSTVHAAKGMEWDRVVVCDDLEELAHIECVAAPGAPCWRFAWSAFTDDVNLW